MPPEEILLALDHLEAVALNAIASELQATFSKLIDQSEQLTKRGDIKGILELNQGLAVSLQRPIIDLWERGWSLGSTHAITDMQTAVPEALRLQSEGFDIGDDIKRAIANLFRLTTKTFRNVGAERAVQRRVLKLAGSFAKDTLDRAKADLLASIQPRQDTGAPISRQELLARLQSGLNVSKVRARAIARTETSTSYNRGRLSSYKDSKLVTHVQFMAIDDHRTSDICQSRAGMIIPIEDADAIAANTPALHVNCRSVLSPLMSVAPNYKRLTGDESRLYKNRKLVPLPKGWRTAS
ncbi:MAG TPA: minor capsid protein [Stenomitos sp.]